MTRVKWKVVLAVGVLALQANAGDSPVAKTDLDNPSVEKPSASDTQNAEKAEEPSLLKTPKDKLSYGLGLAMAKNLQHKGVEVEADLVMKGVWDALMGEDPLMSEEDVRAILAAYQAEARQKQALAIAKAVEENKKAGDAFLEENKVKEGVVTLPSGLQYKVLESGNGERPTVGDIVVCNYRGTLIDGTAFADTNREGKPMAVKLQMMIPGWRQALQLMPVGSKWQLFIPPELAYGAKGAGRTIAPNSTLIFEVELLDIKEPGESAQKPQETTKESS